MKVLVNRLWNKIIINCNGKTIEIFDMIYPMYKDYNIEEISNFEENKETVSINEDKDEYNLFSGTKGNYMELSIFKDGLEIWGTDGKKNTGLDLYAEFKNNNWKILI